MSVIVSKERIAFPPSIQAGEYYFGLSCGKCKSWIAIDQDPSRGKHQPVAKHPNTIILALCYHCQHDGEYAFDLIRSFQADEDRPSIFDARPKSTKQQIYPFLPKHKMALPVFGFGVVEHLPDIAILVSRIITGWTGVEVNFARVLSRAMSAAGSSAGIAVYLSLKNSAARRDALAAAVEVAFQERDKELLSALQKWKDTLEIDRNRIAHGIIGLVPGRKDLMLWVSTTDYGIYRVKVTANKNYDDIQAELYRKVLVYPIGYIAKCADEIETFTQAIIEFVGYHADPVSSRRETRYQQLCRMPRVQTELHRIRSRQQSAPSTPPPKRGKKRTPKSSN